MSYIKAIINVARARINGEFSVKWTVFVSVSVAVCDSWTLDKSVISRVINHVRKSSKQWLIKNIITIH